MQFRGDLVGDMVLTGRLSSEKTRLSRAQRALLSWAMVDDHQAVLDLNCKDAHLLEHLQQQYHVRGCGICSDAELAHGMRLEFPRAEILYVPGRDIPWKDRTFDRVLMADKLPQSIALDEWSDEVLRVMKPGGRLLIAAPLFRERLGVGGCASREQLMKNLLDHGFRDASFRYALPTHGVLVANA